MPKHVVNKKYAYVWVNKYFSHTTTNTCTHDLNTDETKKMTFSQYKKKIVYKIILTKLIIFTCILEDHALQSG